MDPSCSHLLQTEEETRGLRTLLDAFYPLCTLQEIASAYCRAGSDLSKASEILCQPQRSSSEVLNSQNCSNVKTTESGQSICEDSANASCPLGSDKGSKPKKLSATVGSVSTFLGKAYVQPTSSKKEMVESTKPLKLQVRGLSVDELETGSVKQEEHLDHKDIEEFLFSMLGDGFNLSMDVTREVLGKY